MSEQLSSIRALAAWVLILVAGLVEAIYVVRWVQVWQMFGLEEAVALFSFASTWIEFFPALAVVLTGVVAPPTRSARLLAFIAFGQYGLVFLGTVLSLTMLSLKKAGLMFVAPGDESNLLSVPADEVTLEFLLLLAGSGALMAVGIMFCWRVATALRPTWAEEEHDDPGTASVA